MNLVLPTSGMAEGITIGAMMLSSEAVDIARDIVQPDDFVLPTMRLLCEIIYERHDKGEGTTADLVSYSLVDKGQLDKIGGTDYLYELLEGVISWREVTKHAARVKEKADQRRIISESDTFVRDIAETNGDFDVLVGNFAASLNAVVAQRAAKRNGMHFVDAVTMLIEDIEAVNSPDYQEKRMDTGFSKLDAVIGDMRPGQLITVGADTGQGKTTFAVNIMDRAVRRGKAVFMLSAEVMPSEIALRIVQKDMQQSGREIMKRRGGDGLITELGKIKDEAKDWKCYIFSKTATVSEMKRELVRLLGEWKINQPDLIIADHLQLMKAEEGTTRAQQVSNIAWELKQLALDMCCPVIMLSQISRKGHDDNAPPTLSRLKESGDIENNSDVVLLLHLPDQPELNINHMPALLLRVAKCRHGPTTLWEGETAIKLWWNAAHAEMKMAETNENVCQMY